MPTRAFTDGPLTIGAVVLVACACSVLACACSQLGALSDGTSLSYGPPRIGALRDPSRLPDRGAGYWTPPRWRARGLRYGTEEMISAVVYAGRELDRNAPGLKMSIADLSTARGGSSAWHRSHQTGRDVDILFMARDDAGKSLEVERMWKYGQDGQARPPKDGAVIAEGKTLPKVFFDDSANWLVVRALLENPIADVQYIFIADWLKQRLLDHAQEAGEPEELVQRAGYLLHQPSDSLPHDDHMHVRIYCSRTDLNLGCDDFGQLRWIKKEYKYERRFEQPRGLLSQLIRELPAPIQAFFAATLPFRGFFAGDAG
jgi:penicillin-insensitive murein endopeptidase